VLIKVFLPVSVSLLAWSGLLCAASQFTTANLLPAALRIPAWFSTARLYILLRVLSAVLLHASCCGCLLYAFFLHTPPPPHAKWSKPLISGPITLPQLLKNRFLHSCPKIYYSCVPLKGDFRLQAFSLNQFPDSDRGHFESKDWSLVSTTLVIKKKKKILSYFVEILLGCCSHSGARRENRFLKNLETKISCKTPFKHVPFPFLPTCQCFCLPHSTRFCLPLCCRGLCMLPYTCQQALLACSVRGKDPRVITIKINMTVWPWNVYEYMIRFFPSP
jgi:hypothetical protein